MMNLQGIGGAPGMSPYGPADIRPKDKQAPEDNAGNDGKIPAAGKERTPDYDRYIPEDAPRAEDGKQSEKCTANTDKVDREIERLKKEKAKLEQQIRAQSDPARAESLEKQLAQIERELKQKDNDGYRRQHTVFT